MVERPVEAIVLELETVADPITTWRAITEPQAVARWFADVTPIDGIGSPYRIDFGDGSAVAGRVRAFEPGRRLAYSWAWEGEDEGPVTLVTWEVEPLAGQGSRVRLTHDGWSEAGADAAVRDDHSEYWEGYFGALHWVLRGEAEI